MPSELTYPIAPAAAPGESSQSTPGFSPVQFVDFIGFGIITPFRRGSNDFVSSGNLPFLQSLISQVLGTASDSDYTQGELPWRTEFGSLVHFIRHQTNNDVAAELGRVYVADALARWVPQIRLNRINVEKKKGPDGRLTVLLISLNYDVIGINRPGNDVLIPNVNQSVALAA